MGGFDINGFKNAFLGKIQSIAAQEGDNKQIDTTNEVIEAGQELTIFKQELANVSNPIGDTVSFSKSNKEVTTDELLAFLDPEMAKKVDHYIKTKPVVTIQPSQTPKYATEMASLVDDVDINKLNAFLDIAYSSNTANRISASVTTDFPSEEDLYATNRVLDELRNLA